MTEGVLSKQKYDQVVNIVPETMSSVIAECSALLKKHPYNGKFYARLWKAFFFGLWNYDKLMNQHYLCEEIAKLVHILPPEKALPFLRHGLERMERYWERVDHHRINKYMKLLRYFTREAASYLIQHSLPLAELEELLKQCVLKDTSKFSGMAFHVLDIYIEVLQEAGVTVTHEHIDWLFEMLLRSSNREYRDFIVEHVYENAKKLLVASDLQILKSAVIEKAKELQDEQVRRSLYDLYGFLRAEGESDYKFYMQKQENVLQRKRENREKESVGRMRKRLTKGKKRETDRLKAKRSTKRDSRVKHHNLKKKILSKTTLEMRQQR